MSFFRFCFQPIVALTFFMLTVSGASAQKCFDDFAPKICVQTGTADPVCGRDVPSNVPYIDELERVFDLVPPSVQRLFCSLDEVRIVNKTGAALGMYDPAGKRMALVEGLFDPSLTLDRFVFVAPSESLKHFERFEHSYIREREGDRFALLVIGVLHELGHHFHKTFAVGDPFVCPRIQRAFDGEAMKWEQMIRERRYMDKPPVAATNNAEFYHWLAQSPFVTAYAIVNKDEEFAEAFAYHVAQTQLGFRVVIQDQGAVLLDSNSEAFIDAKATHENILKTLLDGYMQDDAGVALAVLDCQK